MCYGHETVVFDGMWTGYAILGMTLFRTKAGPGSGHAMFEHVKVGMETVAAACEKFSCVEAAKTLPAQLVVVGSR